VRKIVIQKKRDSAHGAVPFKKGIKCINAANDVIGAGFFYSLLPLCDEVFF
jgi:hypothetical protein